VPLPTAAIAIIAPLQPDKRKRKGPVFTTNGKTPIGGFSKLKRELDAKLQAHRDRQAKDERTEAETFEHWVFHDLRRSVGTGCQALGFPIEHTEALLNHVSGKRGGLAAIYQLHDYKAEKTAALNAWARHIERLLSPDDGDNVIPLATSRA